MNYSIEKTELQNVAQMALNYDIARALLNMGELSNEDLHTKIDEYCIKTQTPRKIVYSLFRYILTGKEVTPSAKQLVDFLVIQEVRNRIRNYMNYLNTILDMRWIYPEDFK